jgi:acetoin utilization deacetylase AcuC-like enzyme
VYHEGYEVDIGPHVFPTAKYRLILDRLLGDGTIDANDVLRPEPATDADVLRVHTSEYVTKILTDGLNWAERVRLEVPFSAALRDAAWLCAGGSTLAAELALDTGVAMHLGGGFHHAFATHGEGFCLINDVAIAIRTLQREHRIRRAVIIDCDVHQGNGTASIFAGDADIYTFSMHQEANYPEWKPPGKLDIGLGDGVADDEYLALLDRHLRRILPEHAAELAFYLAGADPYREDQLGGLDLTIEGLRARDETVFRRLHEADIPVAVVLAGGYAKNTEDTITIHANTVREAARALRRWAGIAD